MKLSTSIVGFAAGFSLLITASAQATYNVSQIPVLTQCTAECLFPEMMKTGCELADLDCQCKSRKLVEQTYLCMIDRCKVSDLINVGRYRQALCQIKGDESRAMTLRITTATLLAITMPLVILRLATRLLVDKYWSASEQMILLTGVLHCGCGGLIFWLSNNGYGHHVWYLESSQVRWLFKRFYAVSTTYLLSLLFAKMSICFGFLNLLPGKRTRIATFVVLGIIVSSSIAIVVMQLNQCTPVAKSWNKDLPGHCINLNDAALASAGINVGQDLLLLLIPIPMLTKLDVRLIQKVFILFLYGLYGFALVISVVRIYYVRNLGKYLIDPSYDDAPGILWSVIDANVVIICACLPTLPGSIKRIILKWRQHRAYPEFSLHSPSPGPDRPLSGEQPTYLKNDSISTANTAGTRWSQSTIAVPQSSTAKGFKSGDFRVSQTETFGSIDSKYGTETKCYSAHSHPSSIAAATIHEENEKKGETYEEFRMNCSEPIRWSREAPTEYSNSEMVTAPSNPIESQGRRFSSVPSRDSRMNSITPVHRVVSLNGPAENWDEEDGSETDMARTTWIKTTWV